MFYRLDPENSIPVSNHKQYFPTKVAFWTLQLKSGALH